MKKTELLILDQSINNIELGYNQIYKYIMENNPNPISTITVKDITFKVEYSNIMARTYYGTTQRARKIIYINKSIVGKRKLYAETMQHEALHVYYSIMDMTKDNEFHIRTEMEQIKIGDTEKWTETANIKY